ncbi:hypothetical protein CCB80_15600 [Armatimonadetes bacterium Uphvl-Ar1]|nr:hypothetical protein CCB80_15600 [Armatimonadetes bacterium Uphvl-Ar1]
MKHLSFRGLGTVINSGAVVIGSLIGLAVGGSFPDRVQDVAIFGIGLITMGLGVQMFLRTKNPLVTVGAICLGGILGALMGLDMGVEALAEWARVSLGGDSRFNEGFVTACVLFCIGPMTLMGCLQDALERKIELLGLKSLLDGVSSIFMAAALGVGVLVSAVFVLVFQGLLTGLAGFLSGFAKDEELVGESVACGGVIMLAIGLNITGIKEFSSVLFLPSLFLAPLFAIGSRQVLARFSKE